jgi:hypothetical protein
VSKSAHNVSQQRCCSSSCLVRRVQVTCNYGKNSGVDQVGDYVEIGLDSGVAFSRDYISGPPLVNHLSFLAI